MISRPAPPLKVLIVEDEAIIVMDIEAAVEEAGHTVCGDVASVFDLESFVPTEVPDLALVDINLAKGTSGLDASKIVRERWPGTFVVFVTANPRKIPKGHAGSHGVIAKPFTLKGLIAALELICQAICSPPPALPQPASFIRFPAFQASWKG